MVVTEEGAVIFPLDIEFSLAFWRIIYKDYSLNEGVILSEKKRIENLIRFLTPATPARFFVYPKTDLLGFNEFVNSPYIGENDAEEFLEKLNKLTESHKKTHRDSLLFSIFCLPKLFIFEVRIKEDEISSIELTKIVLSEVMQVKRRISELPRLGDEN